MINMYLTRDEIDDLNRDDYANAMYDYLIDLGVATEEEVLLVTGISGWTVEMMDNILYYKTGWRNLAQLLEDHGLLEEE